MSCCALHKRSPQGEAQCCTTKHCATTEHFIDYMAETKEFYTAQDLADKLAVNIMTIYRYIKAGKLKAYKIGKEFRIDKGEFDNFLNAVRT